MPIGCSYLIADHCYGSLCDEQTVGTCSSWLAIRLHFAYLLFDHVADEYLEELLLAHLCSFLVSLIGVNRLNLGYWNTAYGIDSASFSQLYDDYDVEYVQNG